MFFGFDTKPTSQKLLEKSRAVSIERTDIQNILLEAKTTLSQTERDYYNSMENLISVEMRDSVKIELYKRISGDWFKQGLSSISGYYAEKIAEIQNTEDSWSIAGTTHAFTLGKGNETSAKVKEFSRARAINCFDNALSLNPQNVQHRINKAIVYAEFPLSEDPMRGVLSLLELNREYPENTSVIYQLARFGIQTGQLDKAIERLEKLVVMEPEYEKAWCLLTKAYEEARLPEKAREAQLNCKVD
jgi:tetratricopeptide (TPR) repeat protein